MRRTVLKLDLKRRQAAALACAFIFLLCPVPETWSQGKADDICSLAASAPAVRERLAKDHRIKIEELNYLGDKRAHIYLFFSNQPLPYVISLGWFSLNERDGIEVVDENGLILPPLGESPREREFDKASFREVIGFDQLGEHNLIAAEKEFNEALKLGPTNARYNNNLAAVLALRGEYAKAQTLLDKAIDENHSYGAAYANRAMLSLAIGQPAMALEDASMSVKLDAKLIPAKVAYARALMETGKSKEALAFAQALRTAAPDEWQTLLIMPDVLIACGEFKQARTQLERLMMLNPRSSDILLKLAHCFEKLGDLDEAIKRSRQASEVNPDDARAHIALAHYLEENRDEKAAILQYENAMDLKPERALRKTAMGALLRLLIAGQKLARADDFSKKWLRQFPDDAECHFNRAWIASQLKSNHIQESINEYTKALELQPKLSSAHYNLALLLIKSGQNERALKELHAFVETAPDDQDSKSAKELIRKLEGNG